MTFRATSAQMDYLSQQEASNTYSSGSTFNSSDVSGPDGQPLRKPDVSRKLVVTGDGGVGKTCLLVMFAQRTFPEEYVPTVFETYAAHVQHGKQLVEFALWDTAGQEEYDRLRPLSYQEANIILICFAVDFPASLHNVEDKWWPEIAHFCEDVPVILVATKCDLRSDERTKALLSAQGATPVTPAQGQKVAGAIGAKYMETSAKRNDGVQELFKAALAESMRTRAMDRVKSKFRCAIL